MQIENSGFEVINKSSKPYRLVFRGASATPMLDGYIAKGDPKNGKSFSDRDLEENRVAFINLNGSEIDCVPMTWAQHVWTNLDEVRKVLPVNEQLHVLTVSVLLETSDGLFPLSLRSKKVELYPEHWHVSAAGYVDLKKAQGSGSLLHTVFAEIQEELNISPGDITFVQQLGLCRQTRSNSAVVEACYYARTGLESQAVLSLAQNARDTYEGKIHMFLKEKISEMLNSEHFVPSALATISLMYEQ